MAMVRRLVHLITPGDHFSPSTGSAIPTVVDGLSRSAANEAYPSAVLVARGTYADRYDSADALEYDLPVQSATHRYLDAVRGKLGLPRTGVQAAFAAALGNQQGWPGSVVIAHNAPQAIPLIDGRHDAVLYAHNVLLRSYSHREAERTLGDIAAVVCVSAALAEQTEASLPSTQRRRLHVVHNGVDCATFHPAEQPRDDDTVEAQFDAQQAGENGA
jgi:glycosyltransferase involved in cell wall biosynthesis